jgi:CMP-N,N'-diacetyllegionaminic acid synthase
VSQWSLEPDKDLTVLIPARAGSKRVPGKNTRLLGGKPLIEWTIEAAKAAHVAQIIVSSDDPAIYPIARFHELTLHSRKPEHATDTAPDYLWVRDVYPLIKTKYVAICRPTSPFRTASTIRRGFAALVGSKAHSIRAVERVSYPHPAKMWTVLGKYMKPVMSGVINDTPFHSSPTQALPVVYKQNASLEIAQTWVITHTDTISGTLIAPFYTEPLEGFDVNEESDFIEAERLAAQLRGSGDEHDHPLRGDAVAHGSGEGGAGDHPSPGGDREGGKGHRTRPCQGDHP